MQSTPDELARLQVPPGLGGSWGRAGWREDASLLLGGGRPSTGRDQQEQTDAERAGSRGGNGAGMA